MGALSNNSSRVVCSFTFCIYAVIFKPHSVGPWGSEGMPQGCVGGAERARTEGRAPVSPLVHPELLYVLDFPVIFLWEWGAKTSLKTINYTAPWSLQSDIEYYHFHVPSYLMNF